MDFQPDGGQDGPMTGDEMSTRPRRNHSPAFEAKAALAAVKGEKTLAEMAQQLSQKMTAAGSVMTPATSRHQMISTLSANSATSLSGNVDTAHALR
jgi:hypothetical protein